MAVPSFDYEAALLACAQGDQHAFQKLYQHEAPTMLALALKMLTHRAGAEELVRDAFVLIWKNASSFDPQVSTARAWMYSIVRYRALGRLRQPGHNASMVAQWTDTLPDTSPTSKAQRGTFADALAKLEDTQRKAVLMAFFHGHTYEQMATRLKMPAMDLKASLRSGLKRIMELQQA